MDNKIGDKLTIGDEFITWLETYYGIDEHLDGKCKNPSVKRSEYISYGEIKKEFIKHLNFIVQNRINNIF